MSAAWAVEGPDPEVGGPDLVMHEGCATGDPGPAFEIYGGIVARDALTVDVTRRWECECGAVYSVTAQERRADFEPALPGGDQ